MFRSLSRLELFPTLLNALAVPLGHVTHKPLKTMVIPFFGDDYVASEFRASETSTSKLMRASEQSVGKATTPDPALEVNGAGKAVFAVA